MSVLKCSNAKVRGLIEDFSLQYCAPHAIKFTQDGNGDWITSTENLQNVRLIADKENLKQFLDDQGIRVRVRNLKEVLQNFCTVVPYVAPPEVNIESL